MPRPLAPRATINSRRYALMPRSWAHAKPVIAVPSSQTNATSPAVSMAFARVAPDHSGRQNPGSASISLRMAGRSSCLASRITLLARCCRANVRLSGGARRLEYCRPDHDAARSNRLLGGNLDARVKRLLHRTDSVPSLTPANHYWSPRRIARSTGHAPPPARSANGS